MLSDGERHSEVISDASSARSSRDESLAPQAKATLPQPQLEATLGGPHTSTTRAQLTQKHDDDQTHTGMGPAPLPPTANTSPLRDAVRRWDDELRKLHTRFCTQPDNCTGLKSLADILAHATKPNPETTQGLCLHGVEATLLLHGIYHGFPIIDPDKGPTDIPAFEVPNYPRSPHRQYGTHSRTISPATFASRSHS